MCEANKNSKNKRYLAKMSKGNGISYYLEVIMDEKNIYFLRDENGVNAWHCGSLPKTDYRILEIIPCKD